VQPVCGSSPQIADSLNLQLDRPDHKRKKVRWTESEHETEAEEQGQAAKHQDLELTIDKTIRLSVMDDGNTQATQPYTDPRRLGFHSSGISEDDIVNIICILHPSSPAAHEAVAATAERDANHVIPNIDLIDDPDDSFFDPASRFDHASREIALRLSSPVKNTEMGFTFGKLADRCDILLTSDSDDNTISKSHFRIYLNNSGVLMLQDTSTNGTIIDNTHLKCKGPNKTKTTSRMVQNGTVICLLGAERKEIKFLVRVPSRGDHQEAYNANLGKYISRLPGQKSKLVLGGENSYGMHWNGGSVYNVVGCLGKGAFATVYRLATKQDGQIYAAKELDKRRFIKNGILDIKFDNEIQIMKNLRHPNIVQYEDYHDHADWVYIIMELVPGGELSTYMQKNGPLSEAMVQTIARQMLHALAYLHARGITHRDIKPDNVLISELDPLHVKLSDFGLSKCISNQETFLKTFCGTLLYCAPEIYPGYVDYAQSDGRKRRRVGGHSQRTSPYSEKVDMWSFGAVLYHILCNKPPILGTANDKGAQMLNNIMTREIDFEPLFDMGISEEAVHFISNLLKRNPALRPTPRACFEHIWVSEVADLVDYMELDNELPAYRGQGLATVDEADEELHSTSTDDAYAELFEAGGGLSIGYPQPSNTRASKRQRGNPYRRTPAQSPGDVQYPRLPQLPHPENSPAANVQRLFGEITPSLLKSSGVFAAPPPPVSVPVLQHRVEQISVNDFVTFDSSEPPQNTGEASQQPLQYPRALGMPGALPSSAPSLLGAEAQIGQLNMASPEAGHSEGTTPETGNPMTPETRELTPSALQHDTTDASKSSPASASLTQEEPVFTRYIDLKVPESLAHDTEFVEAFNARQAEAKERRAQRAQAKAQTFAGQDRSKQPVEELAKTIDARTGKEVNSIISTAPTSRKIDLPPLESLYPTSTTTPDGFTKPLRRFGKLTSIPGSFADVTIYINSRMTSWGRGAKCNAPYEDKSDTRIPQYAIQLTYYAPGIEARIARRESWEDTPGIHTVVSTQASNCIWVNDVELRKESVEEKCTFYGKIYTGDIIAVYKSADPKGPFLKFRVEINYGDSARKRPANEAGFQVLKETVHHRAELKRRESMKTASKEMSGSASSSKAGSPQDAGSPAKAE
jgi:serine/threonine protein kinase